MADGRRREPDLPCERLREALIAVLEVASVAHNGDPWYCEEAGIDAGRAFALAREALEVAAGG